MQELWVKNISWDEPLEDSMKAKWSEIVESLQKAIQVSIPRQYFPQVTALTRLRRFTNLQMPALKHMELWCTSSRVIA